MNSLVRKSIVSKVIIFFYINLCFLLQSKPKIDSPWSPLNLTNNSEFIQFSTI